MASNTPNYDLIKPAATDFYNVEDQNANMDKLDTALNGLEDGKAATTHAVQHATGGSDPVTPAAIGAATADHTHTPESIGAAEENHTHDDRYFTEAESLDAATAALFGLGGEAVPNDVLAFLGNYNKHWWRRRGNGLHWVSNQILYTGSNAYAAYIGARTIYYSSSYTIDSSGNIVLTNPDTLDVPRYYSSYTTLTQLNGKYCQNFYTNSTSTWYVPAGTDLHMAGQGDDNDVYISIGASTCYTLSTMQVTSVGEWEYLQSDVADTFPNSGITDGYEYHYLSVPISKTPDALKMEYGTYVGTGTYNTSYKNTLTVHETTQIVIVQSASSGLAIFVRPFTKADTTIQTASSSWSSLVASWSGHTLTWYSTVSATAQLNVASTEYDYIEIFE